jgi:hypothetical protein
MPKLGGPKLIGNVMLFIGAIVLAITFGYGLGQLNIWLFEHVKAPSPPAIFKLK